MTVSSRIVLILCARQVASFAHLDLSFFSIPAAEKIVNHPALVLALKDALLSEQESHKSDGSPRSHAAATLMVLERSITPEMGSYENLRDLLDAITPNPATTDDDDQSDEMQPINATAV
jgi:hypothetical protein